MKRLLLLSRVLTLSTWSSAVHAAAPCHGQHLPIVATWFSNLRPASGQREIVYAQFFQGKQRLAGSCFSAAIRYGRHVLDLTGGSTNGHSIASVAFTVPHGLKKRVLRATTAVGASATSAATR